MGGTSDPPEPCPLVKTPIQRHRRQPGSPAPLPHHPDTNINLAGAVRGWLGGQNLIVTTADGAQYGFGVKLDKWSADLANALTARGREVHTTPQLTF